MNRTKLKMWHIRLVAFLYTIMSSLILVSTAFAHDAPPGDDYEMVDWMLYIFLLFFGIGMTTLLVGIKRGWFHNAEDAKYYVLTIDEKDYYSPDWAKELENKNNNPDNQTLIQQT